MESVAAFVWNGWQLCRGISGRIHLESVAALAWNTQGDTWQFPLQIGFVFLAILRMVEHCIDVMKNIPLRDVSIAVMGSELL